VIPHPDDGVLHALLDGEIRAADLPAIEAHLRSCTACLTRLEEARAFRDEADRLVGEIELPVPETSVAVASTQASPVARSRRLHLRPLAYAATLLAALGLGYGMRGWGGSPRNIAADPAASPASLEAVPAAPSESSLADMVSRAESLPARREDDRARAANASPPAAATDTAPRLLARQEAADPAGQRPTAPSPDSTREISASGRRLGSAVGAATPLAPNLEQRRPAETGHATGERRFEGKVTDESGRGIAGASVVVLGTTLRALTGEDGAYRLEGEIPDSSQVTARAIGHKAAAKSVAIADQAIARVDFALPTDVNRLDEVVVTTPSRRAVSALREPVALRTPAPAFQVVDFPEAVRRLGGRIRLVDGLVPTRLDALGDTVRVTYRVGRGRDIQLRQFRVGETVAYTLLAPPDFPADSLARLTSRVTP
jgi:hypothetical protein